MKILIAIDGQDFNKVIADFVLKHDWSADSTFRIINVIEPIYDCTILSFGPLLKSVTEHERHEGKELTADLRNRLVAKNAHIDVSTDVLEGHPRERIIQEALVWKADLIVVGSHSRSGLSRFTLGSVSSGVVAHAPCSVLVLRLPGQVWQETSPAEREFIATRV